MKTYKFGNKIDCIICAKSIGKIGNTIIEYPNQPYTILRDVEASISFYNKQKDMKSTFNVASYNIDSISSITLEDVELTDKIMNLIFEPSAEELYATTENCQPDEGFIYLSLPSEVEEIYDVFLYDIDGALESHYDTFNGNAIQVNLESNYLVCYKYKNQNNVNLKYSTTQYFALDIIITGNTDDETAQSCIHVDACSLQIDKRMTFSKQINTVTLNFNIINSNDNNSYLAIR